MELFELSLPFSRIEAPSRLQQYAGGVTCTCDLTILDSPVSKEYMDNSRISTGRPPDMLVCDHW
jgi:hypothetical protein